VNARAIARQYANALFTVASKVNRTAEVSRDLSAFSELVSTNAELRHVLETPAVAPKKKRELVEALLAAAGQPAGEVSRLLTLLAERDRLPFLAEITAAYVARANEADRVVTADVVTAVELSAERQAALAAALGRATDRHVTVKGRVDPAILGGVVARVGGMVFDGSVASQLERLRQRLATNV
jgi:F-type H+-transporting ATPase subunit delta